MVKKPDTPCAGCGKLLWSGPNSLPAGQRMCRTCQKTPPALRRAPTAPEAAPEVPQSTPADGLGPRGARLWQDMVDERAKMAPPEVALLEEACRTADRLDKLDEFLAGRGEVWLRFHARNEDGSIVRVVVDRALSEVRQQQEAFRGMVADLVKKQQGAKAPEEPEASPSDELANRRATNRRTAGL